MAPGVNVGLRTLINERIQHNLKLILDAQLSEGEEYSFNLAVNRGVVDLLWAWNGASSIKKAARRLENGRSVADIAGQYTPEREAFEQRLIGMEKQHEKAIEDGRMDGAGFMGPKIRRKLEEEKDSVRKKIDQLKKVYVNLKI